MKRSLVSICICLICVGMCASSAGAAPRKPTPKPYDISPVRGRMQVVHDGKGHYLVVVAKYKTISEIRDNAFYGDGKVFYRQAVGAAAKQRGRFSFAIGDPRYERGVESYFQYRPDRVSMRCGDRRTTFKILPAAEGAQLIAKAKFYDIHWKRVPHALARDRRGRYYYVDRLKGRSRSKTYRGFQVYVGPRGRMRRLRMKNVVSDDRGEIFITRRGRLRLILDDPSSQKKSTAAWIAGKRKRELLTISVRKNATRVMIYRELGVYLGQRLQMPCDDLE